MKYHTLNKRNVFSYSVEPEKSKIKVTAELGSGLRS